MIHNDKVYRLVRDVGDCGKCVFWTEDNKCDVITDKNLSISAEHSQDCRDIIVTCDWGSHAYVEQEQYKPRTLRFAD